MSKFSTHYFIPLFFILCTLSTTILAQPQEIATPAINFGNGLVWFLLVLIFTLAYGIPVIVWIYRVLIHGLIEKANKRLESLSMRLSEKFSAAGRKLSEQMRA